MQAYGLLQFGRQAAGEGAGRQIAFGIELRESAFFLGQRHGGGIRRIAHAYRDAHRHVPAVVGVIAQAQHGQRVAQAGKADADAALGGRLGLLLRQRPERDVEHVVQRAHLRGHRFGKSLEIKRWLAVEAERVAHETRQDDGPEVAAAVGRQRLLATRIGCGNRLAIAQVVVLVDRVQKQNARLGKIIGRAHHAVPQFACGHCQVNPQAVGALERAFFNQRRAGPGLVNQLPGLVVGKRLHETVGHADRHIEVVPAPRRALGGDEFLHIGVVDTQHAHLRTTARAGAFHGRARLVEHIDVAARARRHRSGAFDLGIARADARKIVAHAAAAPHGFGGLAQRLVNAGVTVGIHPLNAVTHRLHKAVDQRGLDGRARRAHDAACADGSGVQVLQKQRFVFRAFCFRLDRGQRPRHPAINIFYTAFTGFKVFFLQHVLADSLGRRQILRPAKWISFHVRIPHEKAAGLKPPGSYCICCWTGRTLSPKGPSA